MARSNFSEFSRECYARYLLGSKLFLTRNSIRFYKFVHSERKVTACSSVMFFDNFETSDRFMI